jgi:hypothetical protein
LAWVFPLRTAPPSIRMSEEVSTCHPVIAGNSAARGEEGTAEEKVGESIRRRGKEAKDADAQKKGKRTAATRKATRMAHHGS